MMRIFRLSMTLFFLFAFITPSLAGVVVKDKDGSVNYLSSGKVKIVPPDNESISIYDLRDQTMTLINPGRKSYTTATIAQYTKAAQELKDEAMAKLPPEQRKMMSQFMAKQMQKQKSPEVTIKNLGSGGKVVGYPTTKYLVLNHGEKYEEVYLSNKNLPINREISQDEFWKFEEKFRKSTESGLGMGGIKTVETDPAYQQLMRRGYPLKRVTFYNGRPEVSEQVISMKEKSLPSSEFKAPAGYKKLKVKAFFKQKQQAAVKGQAGMSPSSSYWRPEASQKQEEPAPSPAPPKPAMHSDDGTLSPTSYKKEATGTVDSELKNKLKQGIRGLFGH